MILSNRTHHNCAAKISCQRMGMCFLFSDVEFSATALLSETARIKKHIHRRHKAKNVHKIKYIPANRFRTVH